MHLPEQHTCPGGRCQGVRVQVSNLVVLLAKMLPVRWDCFVTAQERRFLATTDSH